MAAGRCVRPGRCCTVSRVPRIYVLSGPDVGRTYDVEADATFGRGADCTVHLRDASVSRNHARLERAGPGWRIVDAASRNGLFVDGQRVPAAPLTDGDEFRLGEVLLRFREDPEARALEATRLHAPPPPPPPPPAEPKIEFRPLTHVTAEEPPSHEVELEGTWSAAAPPVDLAPQARDAAAAPAAGGAAPRAQRRSAAVDERARKLAAAGVAGAPQRAGERNVLQFHRVEQREGLFAQDFSQQPLWLRALALLFVLVLAAGLAWLAYQGALAVKARVATAEAASEG
jgi:pSer/pThr/pTyr-binding forkhead associated (FHA) protein